MTQLPSDRSIQIWHPPPCPVPHCRGPNCNVTSLVIVLGCSPGHQELLSQVFQRHLQSLGEGAQSVSPHLQDNRTPRARHTETQLHTHTHTHTRTCCKYADSHIIFLEQATVHSPCSRFSKPANRTVRMLDQPLHALCPAWPAGPWSCCGLFPARER